MDLDPIKEKLRKIAELAERGVEGERVEAQAMLEKLCLKHGIALEELLDDKKHPVEFKVRGVEKTILVRVATMVCDTYQIPNREESKEVTLWLTKAQEIDVREAFRHYAKAWRVHQKEAADAFTLANKLFPATREESDEDAPEQTAEERARSRRIALMALGTERSTFRKALGG